MVKSVSNENFKVIWSNIKKKLNTKVDKEDGKGLSTNDFTSVYKAMLDSLNNTIDQRINNKLLLAFPIGTIIESNNSANPSTYIGGTWKQHGAGQVTVGINPSDSDFNTIGKSGGSKELQSHSHNASSSSAGSHGHTGTAQSGGAHNHTASSNSTGAHSHVQNNLTFMNDPSAYDTRPAGSSGFYMGASLKKYSTDSAGAHSHTITVNSGGAHTHNLSINSAGDHTHTISVSNAGTGNSGNLQPYITVYRWIRTA